MLRNKFNKFYKDAVIYVLVALKEYCNMSIQEIENTTGYVIDFIVRSGRDGTWSSLGTIGIERVVRAAVGARGRVIQIAPGFGSVRRCVPC
jgi:hypothetical protein